MKPIRVLLTASIIAAAFVMLSAQGGVDPDLLKEIRGIKAIDNHAHVMRPTADDRDYDALPLDGIDPSDNPVHLRPDDPAFIRAWKALYGYPFADASAAHLKAGLALKQTVMRRHGAGYPAWVLDRQGIDVILANRVAMGPELTGRRFRWVAYADALIFPLDNARQKSANRDYAVLYPLEEQLLARYMRDAGVHALPKTLDEYCRRVVTPTLERQKAGGAVAEKFEAAYLRWLDFGPATEAEASRIYAEQVNGGPPQPADYKVVQDYLFAYVARESGRLGMAIHIHSSNGGGSYYDQRGSHPLLLTWVFNEPTLRKTNFVVIHGGFPYFRETAGLLGKPNVYADTSMWFYLTGAREQSEYFRSWLSGWPEKVLFGTDASPSGPEMNWEETGWVASQTLRQALALALSGMIHDGEITRARASQLAHMVLHDNAAKLYGF